MRNIRIGVVEDDPASCQLVLDYLNRYQQENGEQFTVSVFDDGARIVEKYTPVYDTIQDKAQAATPVPGGVGAVTTAVLAKHLVRAAGL